MPSESAMGTIRGDFCLEVGRNVCHGSDAVESAEKEIAHWFPEGVAEYGESFTNLSGTTCSLIYFVYFVVVLTRLSLRFRILRQGLDLRVS